MQRRYARDAMPLCRRAIASAWSEVENIRSMKIVSDLLASSTSADMSRRNHDTLVSLS
jgi:hypothetical protein